MPDNNHIKIEHELEPFKSISQNSQILKELFF
jgi:hypothetical protein